MEEVVKVGLWPLGVYLPGDGALSLCPYIPMPLHRS
jgi:hypothetical protein